MADLNTTVYGITSNDNLNNNSTNLTTKGYNYSNQSTTGQANITTASTSGLNSETSYYYENNNTGSATTYYDIVNPLTNDSSVRL